MASTSCRCHASSSHTYMPGASQIYSTWNTEPLRINARHRKFSTAAVADRSTALAEKGSQVCCGMSSCASMYWSAPALRCHPALHCELGSGLQSTLNEGIANFYDESSGLWESMWGEHMHHGYYPKDAPPKSNQKAQIDMIEEVLRWAGAKSATAVRSNIFSLRIVIKTKRMSSCACTVIYLHKNHISWQPLSHFP